MQQAELTKSKPLTLDSVEKSISEFFSKSTTPKQKHVLLPKEEQCCDRATD